MKNKKFLAGLLSVAMLAVSGSSFVMAEDTSVLDGITINNFEADTECITIYPSAELDVAALADAITLTENGTALDVTVAATPTVDTYNASTDHPQSDAVSYQIKASGGFDAEKIYNLTIDDYNKVFKIEALLEDDFSGDTSKWQWFQHYGESNNTMTVENGELKIVTDTTGATGCDLLVPADNSMFNAEDYTVSFDFTPVSDNITSYYANFGLNVVGKWVSSCDGYADYPRFTPQAGYVNGYNISAAGGRYFVAKSGVAIGNKTNYKMTAIDGRYAFYADGLKMFDHTSANYTTVGAFGISFYQVGATYTIDNVKMTKLVDLTDVADLTIDNFEADTECLTIYPSAEVNADELAAAITLKEGGVEVDVTVEVVKTHVSDFNKSIIPDYVDNANYSQAPSYKIKKTGGFECEKIYEITIGGLMSADDSTLLKNGYRKLFKIEELFADDFSKDTSKWTFAQESTNSDYWGNNTMEVVGGALQVTTGATNAYLHTLLPADWKNMVNFEDYTVQFDMSMTENNGGDIRLGLATSSGLPIIGSNNNGGVYYVKSNGWINVVIPTETTNSPIDTWSTDETVDEVNATYKMAFKDNRNTLYLDGMKFADYTSEYYDGKGAFGISFVSDNAVYTIDNVIMTKFVDLTDVAELTINEFEADTECITIYPSVELDEEALADAITLTENGKTVDVTVEVVKTHVSDFNKSIIPDYVDNANYSQAPSYKIKKANGFNCNTFYSLTIDQIMSADRAALMANAYKKSFKIEALFADDFSNDASKWTFAQESTNSDYWGNNTMEVVGGALQVTTGATNAYLHTLLPADWKNMVNFEDYTVQFDMSMTENNGGDIRLGLATSSGLPIIGSNNNGGVYHVKSNGWINVVIPTETTNSPIDTWSTDETVDEVNATYKMAFKDNRNTLYLDGMKFADYTSEYYDGKGAFGISFTSNNAVYTIDNVIMTKVVDISDEIMISDIVINNGANETVAGLTSADITVNVQNAYTVGKPCEIVVAVYDSETGDMKNAVTGTTSTLITGNNTITVEDMVINGADTLKVFVFDSLETLTPYCEPKGI